MTSATAAARRDFGHLIVQDQSILSEIRRTYAQTYFRPEQAEFLASPAGQYDLEFNTFIRYNQSVRFALPWVDRIMPLGGKRVLEVGCGTGSSAAAFAQVASAVHTCDVAVGGLETARKRFELLKLSNVTIDEVGAPAFFDVAKKYGTSFDVVLLFAVLEHQTLKERIETLRRSWKLLVPGGILVVIETPNRLSYFDSHTMQQPFWGMLPADVVLRSGEASSEPRFRMVMDSLIARPEADRETSLTRWGRGISFHDVDIAIPRDEYTVVADGYEPEMVNIFHVTYDERLLQSYLAHTRLDVSPAFGRSILSFILCKDGGRGVRPVRYFTPMVGSTGELEMLRQRVPSMTHAQIQASLEHMILYGQNPNYCPL
jgi:2-polyprenyl-3-methyl-5-hydroxy-6-metoxy-1,4-benzoquinol methylase